MAKRLLALAGFVAGLWASVAAAGPVDTPIPANPCAMPIGDFKLALAANESGTDAGGMACGFGGACAEMLIVCTNIGETGDPAIDIGVELFASSGAIIGTVGARCGIAAGATTSFVTDNSIQPPYVGSLALAAGPQVPMGSLRILSTSPKQLACDVTLLDLANVSATGFVTTSKDVTVTKSNKGQKGD